MQRPFANPDTVPPHFSLHSRVALALAHAAVDSETNSKVIPFGSDVRDNLVVHDFVQDFINASAGAWGELINYPIPHEFAKGTAALNGFRHYMIQDGLYLEAFYRVRTQVVGNSGTFEELQEFAAKLTTSLQYVSDFRNDLTNKLGIPKTDIANEKKSPELMKSIELYESVVKGGDWLDIHVVLLPCVMGYDIIANGLLQNPETVRNTVYFTSWIQANSNGSSAAKYRKFINDNIGKLSQTEVERRMPGWTKNFAAACGTEKAFLGLAIPNNFPAYNVVKDETYYIRSYREGNAYLTADPSSVIMQKTKPQDEGKWRLVNAPNGYAIANVKQQGFYLAAILKGPPQPVYQVLLSGDEHRWSINTTTVYRQSGSYLAYQLLAAEKLQLALDWNDGPSKPQVFATNNAGINSQLWLLEPVA